MIKLNPGSYQLQIEIEHHSSKYILGNYQYIPHTEPQGQLGLGGEPMTVISTFLSTVGFSIKPSPRACSSVRVQPSL